MVIISYFLDIIFKDEVYESEKKTLAHLTKRYGEYILPSFDGPHILNELFDRRHEIVHEGKTITGMTDFELNVRVLFLQYLAIELSQRFCDIDSQIFEIKFSVEQKK